MTAAMLRHAKALKFKRTVSQNEEPFRSENLCKFHFLTALVLHESKNLKGSIIIIVIIIIIIIIISLLNPLAQKAKTIKSYCNCG